MDIATSNKVSEETIKDPSDVIVGFPEKLSYGIGGVAFMSVNIIVGAYVLLYMTNVALADVAVLSVIIGVSKVLAVFSDFIIGNVIDHTESEFGKARIWMLRLTIPMVVSLFLLFHIPSTWPDAVKYVYFFIIYNLAGTVLSSFLMVSHFSLMTLITSRASEYGSLSNIRGFFSELAPSVINVGMMPLLILFSGNAANPHVQGAYTKAFIIICAVVLVCNLICVFGTKERVVLPPKPKKQISIGAIRDVAGIFLGDRNLVGMIIMSVVAGIMMAATLSSNLFFATYVLQDPASMSWMSLCIAVTAISVKFVVPVLYRKLDSRQLQIIGLVLSGAGCMAAIPFIKKTVLLGATLLIRGCGSGIMLATQNGLLADIIKNTEKNTGEKLTGKGYAAFLASGKIGQGIGTVLFGMIMSFAGFDAANDAMGISQPSGVLTASTFLFTMWGGILSGIMILIIIFMIRLKKEKAE